MVVEAREARSHHGLGERPLGGPAVALGEAQLLVRGAGRGQQVVAAAQVSEQRGEGQLARAVEERTDPRRQAVVLGPVQLAAGGERGQPLLVGFELGPQRALLGLGGEDLVPQPVGPGGRGGHVGVAVGGGGQLLVERAGLVGPGHGHEGRVLGLEVPDPVVQGDHDRLGVVDGLAGRPLAGGIGGAVGRHGQLRVLARSADRAAGPHGDLACQLGRHAVETGLPDLEPALLEDGHLAPGGVPVGHGAAEHGGQGGAVPGGRTPGPDLLDLGEGTGQQHHGLLGGPEVGPQVGQASRKRLGPGARRGAVRLDLGEQGVHVAAQAADLDEPLGVGAQGLRGLEGGRGVREGPREVEVVLRARH